MKGSIVSKANRKLFILLFLIFGLAVAVYLVLQVQNLRGRAFSEGALVITDDNGNALDYQGSNTYKTNSQHIRIGIGNLEGLR